MNKRQLQFSFSILIIFISSLIYVFIIRLQYMFFILYSFILHFNICSCRIFIYIRFDFSQLTSYRDQRFFFRVFSFSSSSGISPIATIEGDVETRLPRIRNAAGNAGI